MTRTHTLFLFLCLATSACAGGGNLTGSKVVTETSSMADAKQDARSAAENLIGEINMARIALAQKQGDEAKGHVAQAQLLVAQMRNTTTEKRVESLSSGKMVTAEDSHYFPIQAGPMEIKTLNNPSARDDSTVKDAQMVYVTMDLGDSGVPEALLAQADERITAGDLRGADRALGKLTTSIITVDKRVDMPEAKATDNITLAKQFIGQGHYSAAAYALKHVQEALSTMAADTHYASHRNDISALKRDMGVIISALGSASPQLPQDVNGTMDRWSLMIKSWMRTSPPFPNV